MDRSSRLERKESALEKMTLPAGKDMTIEDRRDKDIAPAEQMGI